jgi:hypothetical protein
MARKGRVELAAAVYHVTDRGDRREAIFHDDENRDITDIYKLTTVHYTQVAMFSLPYRKIILGQ